MQPLQILKMLVLLAIANGTPILTKNIFGRRLALPLDGGRKLSDGRPVFGRSKTVRGVLVSVFATTACAPLIGIDMTVGALAALAAMAGDLCSSFAKRRLNLPPSSRAIGLDQIPESLFPMLACRDALSLTAGDIAIGVALFLGGELIASQILFRLHLRDRPY
jgi:CDP-diglyceride synthetase